ncbi:nitroreductase [Streptomyces sodiiphilus]|uniref:Nitroreductase n=1 Tax=Streptomyces sodiiphilus TaxID=226217 RepID=A0ABP5A068_9ACTN
MHETALDTKTVTDLVAEATAAPSMYNAQPWRFRYLKESRTFQLRSDPGRTVPHSDPDSRALHIGCGAALLNLRVAAAHRGWKASAELLPDPSDPELLALVRLVPAGDDAAELAALHPAISRRRTSRAPFDERQVPAALQEELREAARREAACLVFPDRYHVQNVLDLVYDAEGRDAADPGRAEDLARWTRVGHEAAETARDGVPEYTFGPRKHDGKAPVRDFSGRRPVTDREAAVFESAPNLVLLGTAEDRRSDWLRAGQAMERVLLAATLNGLSTALTSHALEWPDLRWVARDPQSDMGYVQMVMRLGYGPEAPGSPRRPAEEVLYIE